MKTVVEMLKKLGSRNEKGQTVIEYILVIVLIALVLVIAFNTGGVKKGIEDASKEIGDGLSAVDVPIGT